ncbi:MAG TPA: M56 family metallopeptidase [Syntrophomonas sp.]|nr:M56 family metallopeptidase [Syntrophomonas sp.]
MTDLFIQLFNMSITATYIIAVVLLIRLLLGRKLPKLFSYALWGIVLLRLMLPFSIATEFSVFNLFNTPLPTSTGVMEYMPQNIGMMGEPQINTGSVVIDSLPAATPAASVNPMQVWIFIAAWLWAGVAVLLLLYFGISYAVMTRRLKTAVPYKNNILLSDQVKSPIVSGIIKPQIILPAAIEKMCGANEIGYIIAHEQVHMKRFDHITKLLSLIVLAIYWFNPAIWLAFVLSNKDRELACDEGVMKRSTGDIRAEYARALVNMGVHKGSFFGALAFGESNIKTRIKSIVNFKKPSLWLSCAGVLIAVVVALACLTNGAGSSAQAKVNQYLDTIVNEESVAASSNPYDYINANPAAFKELVALGEEGREVMLQMFAETEANGLKEYIMAIACNTIKPILADDGFDSGRAWYAAYLSSGENIVKDVVKTDYSQVKIKFLSEMIGFKNTNEFAATDLTIVATVDAMMKSAAPYMGDVPDLKNNHINQYSIEFSSQTGGYSCQLYYDTLYSKAYLEKDGGLHRISTDHARYIDSLLENAKVDTAMDKEAVALFKRYGWTLDYNINRMQVTLGDIGKLSDFEPNAFYFAYNNALSKDIGLDMSPYANTKVKVEIYRIREAMPPASNPNRNTRGIVVKNHAGKIIGAYISAGRHSTFLACSLKGRDFAQATGLTFNKWLEGYVTAAPDKKSRTPEQVITAYFQALDQKKESAARNYIAKEIMLGELSTNILNDALYNKNLSLPLANTTYNTEINNAFGNLKSAKLVKIEPLNADDDTPTSKTFRVTADLEYSPDEFQRSGEQSWDCGMVYETPQSGWKICGFGH